MYLYNYTLIVRFPMANYSKTKRIHTRTRGERAGHRARIVSVYEDVIIILPLFGVFFCSSPSRGKLKLINLSDGVRPQNMVRYTPLLRNDFTIEARKSNKKY